MIRKNQERHPTVQAPPGLSVTLDCLITVAQGIHLTM